MCALSANVIFLLGSFYFAISICCVAITLIALFSNWVLVYSSLQYHLTDLSLLDNLCLLSIILVLLSTLLITNSIVVIYDSLKLVISDLVGICILLPLYHTMISETVVPVGQKCES